MLDRLTVDGAVQCRRLTSVDILVKIHSALKERALYSINPASLVLLSSVSRYLSS
jgi:hypothetical protein